MGSVQPLGGNSPHNDMSSTATLHERRVEYNPSTQTFVPKSGGKTGEIDHMVYVEQRVATMEVPTDFTSPNFLSRVITKTSSKGTQLTTDTKGVKSYFSGDATLYPAFMQSISRAQEVF